MVQQRFIKTLVKLIEVLSDEELKSRKSFVIQNLESSTDKELRRDLRLALRLIEEEQLARKESADLRVQE